MSRTVVAAGFSSLADLSLWYKTRSGAPVTLAEIPEIIKLRWEYFRDNWEFIVNDLKDKRSSFSHPDLLDKQIEDLTRLITVQKNSQNQTVNPFSDSRVITHFYTVWQNVEASSLPITKEENTLISRRVLAAQRFIKTDFINMRNNMINARDSMADDVGLSDSTYNTIFDRSSSATLRNVNIKDINNMQNFQRAIKTVDFILANTGSLNTVTIDPFALARANAKNDEIEIVTGRSGRLVRMFFGDSLQDLASRHFGNPDRWIEIAIANGLKPPYVDEIGQAIPVIANGDDNQLNFGALDGSGNANINKLYINQVIFIQSDTVKFPDQRSILNIKEIPISGEIVLEFNGNNNLDIYKLNENAHIRVFKPNTINSNFLVLIPSEEPISAKKPGDVPFFLESAAEDEKLAGVDLLLNDNLDLTFTSTGDLQLNFGLPNAVQAMQIKMLSEQGQSHRHPNFGLPVVVGTRTTDPNTVKQALVAGITNMVELDERFDRIETLQVGVLNGAASINLVVRMAGSGTLVPISFTINTG